MKVETPMYVAVLPDVAAEGTDRLFDYSVPGELRGQLGRGHLVEAPFGHRKVRGFVIKFVDRPGVDTVKPLLRIIDPEPVLNDELLDLAEWMSEYYMCHIVQSLRALIPPGLRQSRGGRKVVESLFVPDVAGAEALAMELTTQAPRQAEVLRFLLARAEYHPTRTQLARAVGVSSSVIRGLIDRGVIEPRPTRVYRDPFGNDQPSPPKAVPRLTPAQESVLQLMRERLADSDPGCVLLHGVTGSGKTEVYMQVLEEAVRQGRRGIVLVPEISLTPQTVERFRSRFPGRVAVLHSALSTGERYDQWLRIKQGEVDVVVGARSAVFAPLPDLGLFIVDEEHENTYKQEDTPPRYHARDVARRRASELGALVVLGSATPSVESYYDATVGRSKLAVLPERVDRLKLPPVMLVDMRDELRAGNRSVFSRELERALADVLSRRQQALLFLNRRGYSTFVMCRSCGHVVRCESCDVTMTYHFSDDRLRCHYCNRVETPPTTCPACGSRYIRYFGTGTQRIEEATTRLFPGARVARMDVDTTGKKGAHERIYRAFQKGAIDILIGTQMIAKGWDIPNVTLVGVIAADTVLRLPDFRSGERTFQLLTQVAGRAGRGRDGGRVVIQTYDPDHYAIQAASSHDFAQFFDQEIEERHQLGYPPFGRLVRLLLESTDEEAVSGAASELDHILRGEVELVPVDLTVLGPAPAPIGRLRGRYRWQLLLRGPASDPELGPMHNIVRHAVTELYQRGHGNVIVHVDVDPFSLM